MEKDGFIIQSFFESNSFLSRLSTYLLVFTANNSAEAYKRYTR